MRDFSKLDDNRVIIPRAEMYDCRDSTCVTPARLMLNRLSSQLPLDRVWTMRSVMTRLLLLMMRTRFKSLEASFLDKC